MITADYFDSNYDASQSEIESAYEEDEKEEGVVGGRRFVELGFWLQN